MKNSSPDPIRKAARKAVSKRKVGKYARCRVCGEDRPEALVGNTGICAACQRKIRGHATTDKHHIAGKANSPVALAISVNDHRSILSEDQRDWPVTTLENRAADPLLAAAGCIRGFRDIARYLIENLLQWIAEMLEALSALLTERLGPEWWLNTPLARFSPKE